MDGQRFDQLAKAFAHGASRRQVLKGLVGGAVGGALTQVYTQSGRAQCSWSGTFEAPFNGDISMTLNQADGQVTGTYTFTQDNAVRDGTITGVVRTEYPGYSVLDGYWREPGEGGRIWFTMPLETCAQFTGSYTSTDVTEDWTPGWDGVRTSVIGGGEEGAGGEAEATFFSNPGDTRAATYIMDGQSVTLFGPKDPDSGVAYIDQAWISSPDGDPQKQVYLEFDAAGAPMRAAVASGETMLFEWVSSTKVIITYQSADGSQEVQVPFDAAAAAAGDTTAQVHKSAMRAQRRSEGSWLAYTGLSNPAKTLAEPYLALPSAQNAMGSPGVIEVRCGAGELVGEAIVTGSMAPANTPGTPLDVSFRETNPGKFEYSLPIAPAPAPLEGFHRARVERALTIICLGNTAILLTQVSKDVVCAALLGVPAVGTVGFAACEVILTSYVWMCRLNFARMVGGVAVDFFAGSFEVTARAQHPKLGTSQTTVNASAGSPIPTGMINFRGECPEGARCGASGIRNQIACCEDDSDCAEGQVCDLAEGVCVPSPGCAQYVINGTWQTSQSNNYHLTFTFTQSGTALTGTAHFSDEEGARAGYGGAISGPLTGTLVGNRLDFVVSMPPKLDSTLSHGHYTGTVSDGQVSGTARDDAVVNGPTVTWSGSGATSCASGALGPTPMP